MKAGHVSQTQSITPIIKLFMHIPVHVTLKSRFTKKCTSILPGGGGPLCLGIWPGVLIPGMPIPDICPVSGPPGMGLDLTGGVWWLNRCGTELGCGCGGNGLWPTLAKGSTPPLALWKGLLLGSGTWPTKLSASPSSSVNNIDNALH